MRHILLILTTLSLVVISCGDGRGGAVRVDGDTVSFKYAELLQVVRYDKYTVARLADPWHAGKTLHTYVLVPRSNGDVEDLPEGTVIRTPLQHAVPFTTVHTSLIVGLGRQDAIAGVADLKYIRIPYIQQQCHAGRIADVGSGMSPNIEKIIDTHPDAILVSPFENSGGYGKLSEIGIPLIECSDYMETSALGRAEWMRFYGMLFGAEWTADSLFAVVDSSYRAQKAIAAESTVRRSLIMDKLTGSVWYVPGGRSTLGSMIADAEIDYAFASDGHGGSLSLPFETVLEKCGEADIWMFRYSSDRQMTYAELLSEYHGYVGLRPFRERRCYACNVEKSRFYEEAPFRPDYLLGDFIRIAHPELGLEGGLRYFEKLEK